MNVEQHKAESSLKDQLQRIGVTIGYGRSIQLLGQLWDDMLLSAYAGASRHQESMFRRNDIERTEAGLPIGRKVVYFQKRGRKGEITAWMPFDSDIPNVARIVSDTPLYAVAQAPAAPTRAAQDVLAERLRQVSVEDWSHAHDDAHPCGEIAAFAALYAMPPAVRNWPAGDTGFGDTIGAALCPEFWEPKFGDRRRELVKAGALILAEIERLDRANIVEHAKGGAS